ncbi:sn-glycerol-1-phosphate dehydrogenase [Aquibacillus kalidii]|uniref:sn-glycerol-1-phosphate dehydrogenase n=1 Tax=Aquibacillus kalidii TaxID=2762597 RepID=UPI001646983D|nr:sn-glycerol-1-phosphate dehydrogenase [Aquibacillus kalidii]
MASKINDLAESLHVKDFKLPVIEVKENSIDSVSTYIKDSSFKQLVIVADQITNKVAGEKLAERLKKDGLQFHLVILEPNKYGQVIADEETMIQLFSETPTTTDLLIAVGSGTIHDVVRFVGHKMNIPFISVPTAASVDGFTSKGAPLIFKGVKKTVQTTAPLAVFADLSILKNAPREMTAAGFGDILGKYTSLLDWEVSRLVGKEPYNELAAEITRDSLENCVRHVDKIANADTEGIQILVDALIESGLVMLLLDFSRPASGGEHHLSHWWEMDLLKKDKEQLLHGAKVGVATTIITALYKKFASEFDLDNELNLSDYYQPLKEHWKEIKKQIEALPDPEKLIALLQCVGGPSQTSELGISNDLVKESLNTAHNLRDRCTGLLLINQLKKEEITYPISNLVFK